MTTDGLPIELEGGATSCSPHECRSVDPHAAHMALRPALCCVCGTVRLTSAYGGVVDPADGSRCLVLRKCRTCGEQTEHAYLMTVGDRDVDERQPYPELDERTELALLELEVADTRAAGVMVEEQFIADTIAVNLTQYLDSRLWTVLLNPRIGAKDRKLGLRAARAAIKDAAQYTWFVKLDDPVRHCPPVRYALFGLPDA